MQRVVFVCVENSNRSQMAEAFARIHGGGRVEAYSAGSRPSGQINPRAIESMREVGYDLTAHRSKSLADLPDLPFDVAVTMGCGDECPMVRAARRETWDIPDPKHLSPDEFRAVRDLIRDKVQQLLAELESGAARPIERVVRSRYAAVAASGLSTRHDGVRAVAEAFGYSADELASIPAEANMGLSCGNPTAFASLRTGEVVVDLGSGGGLDVLLAAGRIGPTGRAIGIDMTHEMVELARRNAVAGGHANVEFHLATIDDLPLADATVDCVISNCVINLAVDKPKVFREIARVLKPGGRLAVSDIALLQPLPAELGDNLMAYVGCIAGAVLIDEYRQSLFDAGFAGVEVRDSGADLNAYAKVENQSGCCSPPMSGGLSVVSCCTPSTGAAAVALAAAVEAPLHEQLADLLRRYDVNQYAASVRVYAVKP